MSDPKPVRIGVVGCGVVATGYYLPFILDHPHAELTAVCDLEPRRTKECVRLFGAKQQYTDYFDMLDKAELDAVLILTAPGTHAKFALAAIDKGLHLLIQKPMALNLDECHAIVNGVRAKGLKCLAEPTNTSLLNPELSQLREVIDRGVLGDPYWFSLVPTTGTQPSAMHGGNPYGNAAFFAPDSGGILFDYPYFPSQVVSLLGGCKSVVADARISVPQRYIIPDSGYTEYLEQCDDPRDCNYWEVALKADKTEMVPMGAPDNVFSTYELDSGWSGVIHVGRPFHQTTPGAAGGGSLQIYGTAGNCILGGGYAGSIFSEKRDLLPSVNDEGWYHVESLGEKTGRGWPYHRPGSFNYYAESTRHLCECILNDTDPMINAEFGRHITEMMWGSLESARTGTRYQMTTTPTGMRQTAGAAS